MPRTPRLLGSLALVAALAAACGGDDDAQLTEDEQAFADELSASLSDEDGSSYSDVEADCVAETIMGEIGEEPFDEAGVTPEDIADAPEDADSPGMILGAGAITSAQADAILDGWSECSDIESTFVAGIGEEIDVDEDAQACAEDDLRDQGLIVDGYKQILTEEVNDPSAETVSEILSVLDECGVDTTGLVADGDATSGSALVDAIAASLASSGELTEDQAQCLAQEIVDEVGEEELLAGAASGDFSQAPPELQTAVTDAIVNAAATCDVPASALAN
ncbi:MAG: hypothetical protein ABWZ76_09235 [Acidimicrobiales bacterium]